MNECFADLKQSDAFQQYLESGGATNMDLTASSVDGGSNNGVNGGGAGNNNNNGPSAHDRSTDLSLS
jgi:hypothetical protein